MDKLRLKVAAPIFQAYRYKTLISQIPVHTNQRHYRPNYMSDC